MISALLSLKSSEEASKRASPCGAFVHYVGGNVYFKSALCLSS